MRSADEHHDEEVLATLETVDATLAGQPVDPESAELAELALILAHDRPRPAETFTARLDRRVAERFARRPAPRPRRRRWLGPATALAMGSAVAVVVVTSAGGGPSSRPLESRTQAAPASGAPASGAPALQNSGSAKSGSAAPSSGASAAGALAVPVPSPTPVPNGHQIVQSAELSLSTPAARLEQVAQQVFNVVGAVKGNVAESNVTAAGGGNGYAEFQLSVPSSALSLAMAELSRLRGAHVLSRTDSTVDITNRVSSARRQLADARALRTSLLKQLAQATTARQVASLKAQIRDAEASISSDLATVNRLGRQAAFSDIALGISTSPAGHPIAGGGFTLGRAAHDAGRVLVVAAGVALIALAVLLPVGAVAALVAWVVSLIRRRRREQALDLA